MTPEQWSRVESEFAELVEFSPSSRAERLASIRDPEVRREVASLLENTGGGATIAGVIESMAGGLAEEVPVADRKIGPYRIVRRLGQGGQGTVFEAVRDDGTFQQRVAIKVVKWELDTALARERFRQERQILAGIEHPYVAHLLDGGQTENGSPYLVMEYVEGLPLAKAAAGWPLSRKLEMFLKVCDAVDYAHRNLVVHRDLKPANILVTKDGDPKLLDFGIAKLMDPEATRTQTGVFALTPDYASPEQVRGEAITTASDVYSLGVILYQLLTGRKPYSLDTSSPPEGFRIIAEQPPAPPGLGDELDHILLMALRKEPSRRYGSARQMAEDIQRHLEKRPVLARPDTLGYRVRKYVQRYWVGLLAASIALTGICVGAGVAFYQARIAEQRFNDVRRLANTFLFDFDNEIKNVPGTVKARELIVSTALDYLNRLSKSSTRDTGLQWELATAYDKVAQVQGATTEASLRRPQDAIKSEEKAIALARPLDDRHGLDAKQKTDFVNILLHAAIMDRDMKRYDAAKALANEAVARSEGISPDMRFAAMGDLAMVAGEAGDLSGSTAAFERLVDIARTNAEQQPSAFHSRQLGQALNALGEAYADAGRLNEGLKTATEALPIFRAELAEKPGSPARIRDNFYLLNNLGRIEGAFDRPNLGKPLEGAAYFEQSIAVMEPLLAKDANDRAAKHDIGAMEQRLASTLMSANPRRGLPHAERAAALLDAAAPDKVELRAQPRIVIALSYLTLGKLAEAERALKEADRILPPTAGDTEALRNLAWARLENAEGHHGAAAERFQKAIALEEAVFRKAPIPKNACPLAMTLDYAASAIAESAGTYRARIAEVWSDQNQRFPHSPFIERQLADAQGRLAK